MSFPSMLYTLFISPLEIFFEILFNIAFRMIHNPGLSIIVLSLIMNFLLLPLYQRTDKIQMDAIDTEKKLKPFVDHIKKTFKGDEQFMILQTCYRQHHYKPTDALKGLSPLLLEIPFFMAAYNFLSGLDLLHGAALGPIHDLGSPDGLLVIGSLAINVLPILMTVINLMSGAIYTKGAPLKTKVQLYGMAAIFLVLLYGSPSGLVFYWTLNNLFSLVKNMFMKLKKPGLALCILSSLASAALLVFVLFFHPMDTHLKQYLLVAVLLAMQLPLMIYFIRRHHSIRISMPQSSHGKATFLMGSIFLTIFTGLLIPSAVMESSPLEFMDRATLQNPLIFVLSSVLLAAGAFLVWLSVFYGLASPKGKQAMELAVWLGVGAALTDYLFFGTGYGTLSPTLQYIKYPEFSHMLLNICVIAAVSIVFLVVWFKKRTILRFVYGILSLALVAMSAVNILHIQTGYQEAINTLDTTDSHEHIIPLSQDGKNVIVLMMDRAIGGYVPYMFNEKPELKEQFAGFTYYPNTMSYGGYTNAGSPALYGGYEYTPVEINRRDQESLCSKQNEALKVMPVLFDSNGYEVTVCDPSYAGYTWIPDLSIYDDYPDIDAYITLARYNDIDKDRQVQENSGMRNFFCYSLFRIAPTVLQSSLYDGGFYNAPYVPSSSVQKLDGILKSTGTTDNFANAYNVLRSLPRMTEIREGSQDTFLMMSNDTTHEPMLLQEPEYAPSLRVDNTQYELEHQDRLTLDGRTMHMDDEYQVIHYQSNMASMIQLGKWFDFMRENGVYDNTRIIIVADHGRDLRQFDDMLFGPSRFEDAMYYNPLLMVKDFGAEEFTTDNTFMTNGDVPSIAFHQLVEDPINPFTGKHINNPAAKEGEQFILQTTVATNVNNGNTFLPGHWYSCHDNIFDMNNWRTLPDSEIPN